MKLAMSDEFGNPVLLTDLQGAPQTPTVIFLGADPPLVGQAALNAMPQDPSRCILDGKRHMGTDDVLAVGLDGREYRARDWAVLCLEYCKKVYHDKTGDVLQAVVIAIPANYTQRQREETKAAAESIGLEVIALVHEPTAAALGNQVQARPDGKYLVVDVGAGTTDVSLVLKSGNSMDVVATMGIPDLGSIDIDSKLVELAVNAYTAEYGTPPDLDQDKLLALDMRQRAEQCKHALSRTATATMVVNCQGKTTCVTVTQEEFRKLIADWTQRVIDCVMKVLAESHVAPKDLVEVLLVGGGSFTCGLHDSLENATGIRPSSRCEAMYAAAYGAVIAGRMELGRQNRPLMVGSTLVPPIRFFTREVTSHDIGVTVVTKDYQRLLNCAILRRNTPIPCDRSAPFKLAGEGQTDARVELLQGEDGAERDECLVMGHFDLSDLPPIQGSPHGFDIRLRIDRNGLLTAWAQDTPSGKTAELTVDYKAAGNTGKS
jgi:molecular chaperone DnaK (HSP70)